MSISTPHFEDILKPKKKKYAVCDYVIVLVVVGVFVCVKILLVFLLLPKPACLIPPYWPNLGIVCGAPSLFQGI